jgi:beta-galactosidase
VSVTAALVDGSAQLATVAAKVAVTGIGDTVTTLTISGLPDVTRWSPDTPKLYQVSATIQADGVSHTVEVNTGFREATFEDGGFYLNGERLEIFGLNRHQLFPYTGMAAPERLQRRDAERLKDELNCNMVRCSHYPQSPHFLDACDELGLMVWEEPPGWQYVGNATFQSIVVQNVHDMVVRDRNRPSVIVLGHSPERDRQRAGALCPDAPACRHARRLTSDHRCDVLPEHDVGLGTGRLRL